MRLIDVRITLPAVLLAMFSQVGTSEGSAKVKEAGRAFYLSQAYAQTSTGAERSKQIKITIGSKTFTAALEDNATARAFRALLPMTINMTELNGNEKYFRFSDNLPVNASNPGTIQIGDLMIYGARTLVLFYKSFPTSYEYARLGRINDTRGLAAAVGSGSVKVTFEQE
jgi:hypothetical protein